MAKKDPSRRKIDTGGGSYIEGDINTGGGDFVGRDQNKITIGGNVTGSTLVVGNGNLVNAPQTSGSVAELAQLIREIRAQLPQANLDMDTVEAIEGDFHVVENQLAKPEPKKALVLPKLKSIAEVLGTAVAAGEAVQKLAPMIQQALTWAQHLLK